MAKLKEVAEDYESKQVGNIADLDEVNVDLDVQDGEFEVEEDGKTKTVKYRYIEVDNEHYRVPNSVLKQLKVHLEDNPDLKKFKVNKSGKGLNTDYTVIPIIKPK
ncbi:MAG: hypothetical protein ACOC5T_08370 [Elusimicrobiota bacterium]